MADPKTLLAALEANGALDFPPGALAAAREALATDAPSVEALSELPAPLLDALFEASVLRRRTRWLNRVLAAPDKALIKRAKKAAYRLKSVGVEVEGPPTPEVTPPSPSPEPVEQLPALLSGVSGTGERALVVARPQRGGGLELYQLVLSDELGVLHADRYPMSRAGYRQQLKELRRGEVPATLEIPLERAREELAEGLAANLASRTPLPPQASELMRLLEISPQPPAALPAPEEGDAPLAAQSHTLHDEPELRGWLPPESELERVSSQMEQVLASPLQLSEAQRSERMFELFRRAAVDFFTPEHKQLYARRLWRMAELFERTGRDRQAKVARAEARSLFQGAPGHFSRFGEMLYEKVLHLSKVLP